MSLSVNNTLDSLPEEIQKRDQHILQQNTQIAENSLTLTEIARLNQENNAMLIALSKARQDQSEQIESLALKIERMQSDPKIQTQTSDKVSQVAAIIIIIGLIAIGIFIGLLRYRIF